jgi:hypothetical protein
LGPIDWRSSEFIRTYLDFDLSLVELIDDLSAEGLSLEEEGVLGDLVGVHDVHELGREVLYLGVERRLIEQGRHGLLVN